MSARIIPQAFTKGAIVKVHPLYKGPTGRGIQRNKSYTLVADATETTVEFLDDHGFRRYRPLSQFFQYAP